MNHLKQVEEMERALYDYLTVQVEGIRPIAPFSSLSASQRSRLTRAVFVGVSDVDVMAFLGRRSSRTKMHKGEHDENRSRLRLVRVPRHRRPVVGGAA